MIILIGVAVAVIYFGLLYAAPGRDNRSSRKPAAGQPTVFRNITLTVVSFLLFDGIIFHSGLYTAILKPESQAGEVWRCAREENRRQARSRAGNEIVLLGDSRVALGFSNEVANEIVAGTNTAFIQCATRGTSARIWHYLLRQIDPRRNRYRAIVVPLKADDTELGRQGTERASEIVQIAPLLRYSDALSFSANFQHWPRRARAFLACVVRGSAYQSDVSDLFEHPAARMADLHHKMGAASPDWDRKLRNRDLSGLKVNPINGRVEEFPDDMSERQRRQIVRHWRQLRHEREGIDYTWSKRIVERYASSSTPVVFLRMPRGPLASFLPSNKALGETADELWLSRHAVVFDYRTFEFLETPEYFLDYTHLNDKGRGLFTKRLAEELLARLKINSARSAEADVSDSSFD
ncbi:MAG: hypothetical protein ABR514_07530 [Chthoniobacterales bacterium]